MRRRNGEARVTRSCLLAGLVAIEIVSHLL